MEDCLFEVNVAIFMQNERLVKNCFEGNSKKTVSSMTYLVQGRRVAPTSHKCNNRLCICVQFVSQLYLVLIENVQTWSCQSRLTF